MLPLPDLPNGAPGHRLRHLSQHLHDLGPRALQGFLRQLIAGEMPDAAAVVEALERHARFDPGIMKAIGGYDLPPPMTDLTWVIEMDKRLGRVPTPRRHAQWAGSKPPPLCLVPTSLKPTKLAR